MRAMQFRDLCVMLSFDFLFGMRAIYVFVFKASSSSALHCLEITLFTAAACILSAA